jgi:hypothetical protein
MGITDFVFGYMMFEELILWFTPILSKDNNAHSGYYDDLLRREF